VNLKDLLRRWRALTHRDELDQNLDEELRFHLDRLIEQNIKNGMTPEDARYAAMKSFSRVDQSKEECRDAPMLGEYLTLTIDDAREYTRYDERCRGRISGDRIAARTTRC